MTPTIPFTSPTGLSSWSACRRSARPSLPAVHRLALPLPLGASVRVALRVHARGTSERPGSVPDLVPVARCVRYLRPTSRAWRFGIVLCHLVQVEMKGSRAADADVRRTCRHRTGCLLEPMIAPHELRARLKAHAC